MTASPPSSPQEPEREGDQRPAVPAPLDASGKPVEPVDLAYLMRLSDALNTTLDLDTLLKRTSELVRALIQYRIFAIFLLIHRTQ